MTELVMVGTVHLGNKDYKKALRKLIEKEKPSVICLELNNIKNAKAISE